MLNRASCSRWMRSRSGSPSAGGGASSSDFPLASAGWARDAGGTRRMALGRPGGGVRTAGTRAGALVASGGRAAGARVGGALTAVALGAGPGAGLAAGMGFAAGLALDGASGGAPMVAAYGLDFRVTGGPGCLAPMVSAWGLDLAGEVSGAG